MPSNDDFGSYIGQRLQTIEGFVPEVGHFPSGCRFRNRCRYRTEACLQTPPPSEASEGHRYWCWHPAGEG